MAPATLDWLKRPIAHRGLHDARRGIIENSASAIEAALAKDYGIEVDLQCAADGVPVVFHDRSLERLTQETGPVRAHDAASLRAIPLRGSQDCILSLEELLSIVNGRVPLLLEVKSMQGGDARYEANIAHRLAAYRGKVAVMSFDPRALASFRRIAPDLPRGLVAGWVDVERSRHPVSSILGRFSLWPILLAAIAKPDFIAYDIHALPALAPMLARRLFGLPLLTWTVRNAAEKERAMRYADAMIFEGIVP